ncbi:MAG: HAMP domain-containing protein [Bryobacterales bacterium]|nr:HAMP domain-containing protein [Bryobacterales bacterium]MBV9401085.1 HAMP domain-containing protein [Bryobacterales bacterium]
MAKLTRAFGIPKLPVRFARGLRFRLMLSYVLFFTLLLIAVGLFFREVLKSQLEGDIQMLLEDDWGSIKGWVSIDNERPVWSAPADEDETQIVAQLKQVYFIADREGHALEDSETYRSIGFDPLPDIKRVLNMPEGFTEYVTRWGSDGTPYLVKRGWLVGTHRKRYFLAMGRSLADSQRNVARFTRNYFLFVPGIIALSSLLGWMVAGRALWPLNSVAQAAQNITGSNLSLRIPPRGAGDELDHLIDSFNRMTARLAQSFEQIRRFSTDVSHELRTPLTSIRGQLEVAIFTAEKPEQYREAMVNALEDVEQLSSIVRALLLLSQAESGQLVLQRSPLDLGDVAIDIVEQFQIPAQEKDIRLTASVAPGCVVPADRVQIKRLISNLLSNAIKYTPAGGAVNVRVGPGDSPALASLEIEDTGVGIAPEDLPHIFDRFYRVRNAETNKISGLGLGLSFVSWIVEAHGGRIDVASTVGSGTRFRILLPRQAETEAVQPMETDTATTAA